MRTTVLLLALALAGCGGSSSSTESTSTSGSSGSEATRSDIVDFLRGADEARLGTGWRRDLVGHQLGDIVSGRAALAFDGRGGLVLRPVD